MSSGVLQHHVKLISTNRCQLALHQVNPGERKPAIFWVFKKHDTDKKRCGWEAEDILQEVNKVKAGEANEQPDKEQESERVLHCFNSPSRVLGPGVNSTTVNKQVPVFGAPADPAQYEAADNSKMATNDSSEQVNGLQVFSGGIVEVQKPVNRRDYWSGRE